VAYAGSNLWAWYHFRSGRSCLEKYHDAEGLEHLRQCLKVWHHDPEALLLAARASRRVGDFADAEKFQEQYEQAAGENDNLTLEGVLLRAERGEVDAVRDFCQVLVNQDHPDTALVLEAQARGYLRQYRLAEAFRCLKQWQNRQPENPQVFFLKALLYDQNLNRQAAIYCYRWVVELDPERDDARQRLARHLLDRGAGRDALTYVRELLERQPDNPDVRVLLARCRTQLNEPVRAEELLDEVLADHPRHSEALAERGNLARQLGQTKAAETWLRKAADLEPAHYQVHYRLWEVLKRNGKKSEANKVRKRLRRMEHDMERMQTIITRLMPSRPHDAALHYEVGLISFRAGNIKEGLRWLHSTIDLDPNNARAHRLLALFYDQTGSPARAAKHWKAVKAALASGPVPSASREGTVLQKGQTP
jgi:tetratricopeptide (TPR) repeat protein